MSAETASDYYTKTQTDVGFQVKDADLTTVATIGTSDQLLKVKNDGSGLEWFTPTYISSYTETDPQVGTIASSGIPRWNGTALVTGSLTDDGTSVSTSGTFTSSNLSGTNTGDITIGTASGLSLTGQALSLSTATTTAAGAMSASDKVKLNSIATGAEVNVNADWNAVSGDAEILNKPTLGTMSAETASDYYTKTQTDAGFQVKDADLTTVATIGTSDQLLKVKNDGSGLEWFTPSYISSYTETDPQVGTIATSGIPRWNGTALVTGSLSDDGTNLTTSGTFTSSNLSGTNTGDITIGTASGLSLTGQALSLSIATTTAAGAMSASDKTKLNSIATGAEVNVNADWNAVSGDAEILNKPTLGTMSAETASDYYTKTQTDAGFQVKDADLTTVATIGTSDQQIKVKSDGSGLEWFTPSQSSSSNPVGTILSFASATAPSGYLVCDGSAVSRTTYSDLFTVIGTTWGAGDGSTTFNIPDLRGRTQIGSGQGSSLTSRTLGQIGGAETHTLTIQEMPAHTHSLPSVNGGGDYKHGLNVVANTGNPTAPTRSEGGSQPHNNMQPFSVVTFIIKY
jgi:microcystin-dependent protein